MATERSHVIAAMALKRTVLCMEMLPKPTTASWTIKFESRLIYIKRVLHSIHHLPKREAISQEQSSSRYARYKPRAFQIGNTAADSLDFETQMIGNVLIRHRNIEVFCFSQSHP